jgi:hypothetical protein
MGEIITVYHQTGIAITEPTKGQAVGATNKVLNLDKPFLRKDVNVEGKIVIIFLNTRNTLN